MGPSLEQIAKLPKWAQDYIRNIESALEVSRKTMTKFCDAQTPSRVWYEDLVCDAPTGGPSLRRVYLQTNRIVFGDDSQIQKTLTVQVDLHDQDVYYVSADGMQIKPRAYNSVEIKVGERQ